MLWPKYKSGKIRNAMAWLGVHFTYNIELSNKKEFFDKLGSVKKTLIVWSQTDLSLNGRIDIVKTLVLSKLVFISSVMETPKKLCNRG